MFSQNSRRLLKEMFSDEKTVDTQRPSDNAGAIDTMYVSPNPQSNSLTSKITLGSNYFEQYWKYNDSANEPVYLLTISPKYNTASKAQLRYSNNYEHPALFIPLKEKHLYTPLWDTNMNSKYDFTLRPFNRGFNAISKNQ